MPDVVSKLAQDGWPVMENVSVLGMPAGSAPKNSLPTGGKTYGVPTLPLVGGVPVMVGGGVANGGYGGWLAAWLPLIRVVMV